MSRALYRQYRSTSFDEVVGQEHITDLLAEAIAKDSISHAYLFTGPRGVGKTSVARILAHEINKVPYSESINLDIIEIDAASNRRIDDIRDLREKVHIAPSHALYKVYIIDEVHMLTGESFNALLKTLEEPPAHVVFILATTELHKVPATIASRTQRYAFRPVTNDKVSAHLRSIADKESIKIDDEALRLIADHGEGSFRDSISLLDQLSSLKTNTITVADIEHVLGLAPKEQLTDLVKAIAKKDGPAAIGILKRLFDDGHAPTSLTAQLLTLIANQAESTPVLYDVLHELLDVPRSYTPQIKLLTVVARACQKPKVSRSMPLTAPIDAVISAPIARIKKVPTSTASKPTQDVEPTPRIAPEPLVSDVARDKRMAKSFDWNVIMDMLHKRHTALHSVLKRAEMNLEGNVLTLTFAYNLHRKKLEDSKYRTQLVELIADTCGVAPELRVVLRDQNIAPKDPVAASVADIMGGGVEVNA